LVAEQRGLCCYCLSRIDSDRDHMKVEHWHCQANYPNERLVYSNLLGACLGNEGKRRSDQHCDTFKGDIDLSRNPANPGYRIEDSIRFLGDGTIRSDDTVLNDELDRVLNLNCALLKSNRKAVLDGLIDTLPKRGELPVATWERLLRDWNGESTTGNMREFCQVVVYWLRKRLRRT
jgi:uncharacterized protein (TIGR02646 family)